MTKLYDPKDMKQVPDVVDIALIGVALAAAGYFVYLQFVKKPASTVPAAP